MKGIAVICTVSAFFLQGCAGLLPTSEAVTSTPWKTFDDAKKVYDSVVPGVTTTRDLKAVGFGLYSTPNVKVLNYMDIAVVTQNFKRSDLDKGLVQCLDARERCSGYELEPKDLKSRRYGNFWLDIFNFKRKIRDTGWSLKVLFLVVDDIITYKLWSGNPNILEEKQVKNPLGPLQDVGGFVQRVIPN